MFRCQSALLTVASPQNSIAMRHIQSMISEHRPCGGASPRLSDILPRVLLLFPEALGLVFIQFALRHYHIN